MQENNQVISSDRCDSDNFLKRKDMLIIGIAGGTGSGKTTLTRYIMEKFKGEVSVLYHDNYYHAYQELSFAERCQINYDHPDSFDNDFLFEQITMLRNGQAIDSPVYDYKEYTRKDKTVKIVPKKVLLIEGILIFHDPRLADLMDLRIFVDADADVRILRRIKRDVKKRGRTLESVIEQYITMVKPMHELFVVPSKRRADIIIPDGAKNPVALDMVFRKIFSHIHYVNYRKYNNRKRN